MVSFQFLCEWNRNAKSFRQPEILKSHLIDWNVILCLPFSEIRIYNAAISELSSGNYPALSARLALGDVTLTQQIGAMAQMLAMLSYQLGLAEVEPWVKARDNMVLADAAMRGVLPYGKAAIYRANIINKGVYTHNITAGRRLLDNKGRIWTIANGTTIASGETQSVQIEQYELSEKVHTVTEKKIFLHNQYSTA